jgi:hypothetical protein
LVSKSDKKTITLVLVFKIILITFVVLLIVPVFQVEEEVICVTEPCINPVHQRSGINLIQEHFEQTFEEPVACIQLFEPVCGVDGVTYSNQCFADVAGVDVQFKGQCG